MPHGLPYPRQRGFVDQFLDRRDIGRHRTRRTRSATCCAGELAAPPSTTVRTPSA